jgi:murein DD-endopeptidase MepM/ murein hydrolase activator NlpD
MVAAQLVVRPSAAAAVSSQAAPGTGSDWIRPVDGTVVRSYEEPTGPYAPGHRGVDFAAPVGTPVRVASDGVVTFAGPVAGSLHVVVLHDGGIRTSYSFLSRVDVVTGDAVPRGQGVGAAGGSGDGHDPGVLHFGVRVGERYVDPMLLFRPRDLTHLVRLVPSGERLEEARPTPDEEAAALYRSIINDADTDDGCGGGGVLGGALSTLCDAAGDALDVGLAAVRAVGDEGAALARTIAGPMHALLEAIRPLTEFARRYVLTMTPGGRVLSDLLTIGERVLDQLSRDCDPRAPAADGSGGSGNAVVAVGGIDSHRERAVDAHGRPTSSFGFQPAALGYRADDVRYFSYRKGSDTYAGHDTHEPILTSARLLADQVREWARLHPGRRFDLVGHSQGGVVILAFLAFFYRGHEAEYPRIDNVVTFASPLAGDPLATTNEAIRRILLTRLLLDAVGAANPLAPPESNSPSVLDLSESSKLMKSLRDFEVPASVHWTSITGTADFIVPSQQGHVDGATEVAVTVGNPWSPVDDHSGILKDADALAAARAGLEHRPPPCPSIGTTLVGSVAPVAFARVAHTAGDLSWLP